MSDQENVASPVRTAFKKSDSARRSESNSPSVSRSRSRSPRRRNKYSKSNSRSRSRSHKYSRSRSRSPPAKFRRRRYSRSRSRSRSPRRPYYNNSNNSRDRRRPRRRSRSHSPMSHRRRHDGNRDDPEPTSCLGVFGLSLHTQERELRDTFSKYGSVDRVQIVYDRQSGRSRGFCFIYFRSVDDAIEAKDRCTGIEIDGRSIRVDYSITHRAHTPTPGIYLGKPTEPASRHRSPSPYRSSYRSRRSPSPYKGGYRSRRSPSPYRKRSRSRSRSYSPRRY